MPLSSGAALSLDRMRPVISSSVLDQGSLLDRLATRLQDRGVVYCQWKGHWRGHRWASGRGDVDLLVDRESMVPFSRVLDELGFKAALPSGERQFPGVESYLGHDPAVPRLLHLHVHFRLVLGDYWRTIYRLPIERALLEAAIPGLPFKVPTPAYQHLLFVLRMVLRQRGRPLLPPRALWLRGIQGQLDFLDGRCNREEVASILERHLPSVDLHPSHPDRSSPRDG
jgi:hypothetical protein